MIAEPLTPEKCIGDAMVKKGAEAPKPHLPPIEVRMLLYAVGDLLPAGTASTAMRATFTRPLFLGASAKRPRREPARQTSTSLPLLLGGRSYKLNQGKTWCLIQADV